MSRKVRTVLANDVELKRSQRIYSSLFDVRKRLFEAKKDEIRTIVKDALGTVTKYDLSMVAPIILAYCFTNPDPTFKEMCSECNSTLLKISNLIPGNRFKFVQIKYSYTKCRSSELLQTLNVELNEKQIEIIRQEQENIILPCIWFMTQKGNTTIGIRYSRVGNFFVFTSSDGYRQIPISVEYH